MFNEPVSAREAFLSLEAFYTSCKLEKKNQVSLNATQKASKSKCNGRIYLQAIVY